MTHITCRLTAKNRDQLRDPTLGNRVWAAFALFTMRRPNDRAEHQLSASLSDESPKGACLLHGLAPSYLNDLVRVADLPGRRRLRSSSSHQLLVPPFRLTTVGRRTFPVAASLLWNSLPSDFQSFPSLPVFRQRHKAFLFRQSFPTIVL